MEKNLFDSIFALCSKEKSPFMKVHITIEEGLRIYQWKLHMNNKKKKKQVV